MKGVFKILFIEIFLLKLFMETWCKYSRKTLKKKLQSFEEIFLQPPLQCISILANLSSLLSNGYRLMPDTVSKHYSLLCNLMVSILALFFEPSELQVHHFHLEHFKGDKPSQFFKCKLTKKTFNTKLFFQKNALDYQTYFNSVRICEMFLSACCIKHFKYLTTTYLKYQMHIN